MAMEGGGRVSWSSNITQNRPWGWWVAGCFWFSLFGQEMHLKDINFTSKHKMTKWPPCYSDGRPEGSDGAGESQGKMILVFKIKAR